MQVKGSSTTLHLRPIIVGDNFVVLRFGFRPKVIGYKVVLETGRRGSNT